MNKIIIVHYEEDPAAIYAFKCAVEKLWKQHSEYARSAMISILAGLGDIDVVSARLMKNQEELGAAIIPYYGEDAAAALTSLLKDCINTAVEIFKAIKDSKSTTDLEIKWDNNATALARFLDTADTDNWPYDTVLSVLKDKHANALKQAKSRYAKDWAADIEANDASYDNIYALASTFSGGIIEKFPEAFVMQYSSKTIKKK